MTPEQRADQLVKHFWEKNAWDKNFDQSDLARELIAGAIREAITEEREACARVIEEQSRLVTQLSDSTRHEPICRDLAKAIRTRSNP